MANLSPEQERIDIAHKPNGIGCLPNCNRHHIGQPIEPLTQVCSWCDRQISIDTNARIAHNEYHLANPESITK